MTISARRRLPRLIKHEQEQREPLPYWPGGSPEVAISPLARTTTVQEADWIVVSESASHPFWSRDGHLLYCLPTFPNVDIRSRVLARRFDPSTGRVTSEATEVLTLREMIVPAMVTGITPIVAPDQIIFVLGDFRGDVWIKDVETALALTKPIARVRSTRRAERLGT